MNVQTFPATGSDGGKYTVRKLTTHVKTTSQSAAGPKVEEGMARWELANGDALKATDDRRVFIHYADPSLIITLD